LKSTKQLAQFKQQKVNETIQEAQDLLNTVHKCLIERPTGFGKTYSITQISAGYDKVYYLFPRDVIEKDVIDKYPIIIPRIQNGEFKFISYMKIVSMAKDHRLMQDFMADELQQKNKKILFILDEAHLAGAPQTRKALLDLFQRFPDAYYLGASATPFRMDGINIVTDFFDGFKVSDYGIGDAINDQLFAKPEYIYSTYDIDLALSTLDKKIEKMVFKSEELKNRVIDEMTSKKIEYSRIANVDAVLKRHIVQQSYMKFIVFFPNKDTLFSMRNQVLGWFNNVFPSYNVNHIILISTNQYKDNIIQIQKLRPVNDSIDLIFCIDMLNMGYHIDDLDGIIMLRPTQSDTIYKQQLGRCISIASNKTPVIFDFVGNSDKMQRGYTVISNGGGINQNNNMNLGFEHLNMHDYTKDFMQISRIYNTYAAKQNMSFYLDAYANKFAPLQWVYKQLGISDIHELRDLLQVEGLDLRDCDKPLLT
jgi:superfamily II DNA or RNA helicase